MNVQERHEREEPPSWAEQAWWDWDCEPWQRCVHAHEAFVTGYNAGLVKGSLVERAATEHEMTEKEELSPAEEIERGLTRFRKRVERLEEQAVEWRQDSNDLSDQIATLDFELRVAHSVLPKKCKHAD